jgi:MFS family permease
MSVEIVSSVGNELAAAQRKEFRAAFIIVAPATFLGSLDRTIIGAVLPVVARAFGEFSYLTWIVTGYLSAATIVAPIYSLRR